MKTRKEIKAKFHDMFLDMIDNVPMSIVITDAHANIEYVNLHFSYLTGYTFEEALGKNPSILQSGQTPPEVYKDLWAHLSRGESWKGELINLKKNGDVYIELASISPILDNEGGLHYVAFKIDGTEQKKMKALINTDPLTSLFSRFYLNERLQHDLDICQSLGKSLSLIFLDIDAFKEINDRYGHPVGDQVLRAVGKILQLNIRSEESWIARYGGDEFVICLPGVGAENAYKIAERLRLSFNAHPYYREGIDLHISCSMGVETVSGCDESMSADALIKAADKKLYIAKESGRNIVVS